MSNQTGIDLEDAKEKTGAPSLDGLTRQRLLELESAPRTKAQIITDYVICIMPFIVGIAAELEYFFVPNYGSNQITKVYPVFLGILMAAIAVFFGIGLFHKAVFTKLREKAPFYTLIFVLLIAYDLLTLKSNTLVSPYFPYVDQILNAFFTDSAYLIESVRCSLILLFTGYAWGAGLGLITGIACGYNKKFNYWLSPFLKLLGAIPSVTWIPITLVLMKTLFQASTFVIALGVWFAMTIACITGIQNIEKANFEAARTLGARGKQLIFHIAIPSIVPNIFQGLTQGMSTACMALITAEMIGSDAGLGWYITWQRSWAQYAKMYAAIVLLCIIFVSVNGILNAIKRRVLRWKEGDER